MERDNSESKKSIFKRWWFWALVAVAVIVAISALGDDTYTGDKVPDLSTSPQADPSPSPNESPAITNTASPIPTPTSTPSPSPEESPIAGETTGQKNALRSAKSYLSFSAFSYKGLVEQLMYEKYSREDAIYAADNCGADWFEQAVKAAESYLSFSSFSRDGLIEQLEYDGFTHEQAVHGAEENGY
jgi:hypothetical protein